MQTQILNAVQEVKAVNPFAGISLPKLWERIGKPDIATFQATLKKMADAHLIHLIPWTEPIAFLPDRSLAFEYKKEIKFFVDLF